jgi:hypothetical protein
MFVFSGNILLPGLFILEFKQIYEWTTNK